MDTPRICMSHSYGQTPPNVFSDYDWVRRHEKELLEQYGECSIIVYKEQVIGVGDSLEAALQDAERNLPPDVGEITPIHEWLGSRHPFCAPYQGTLRFLTRITSKTMPRIQLRIYAAPGQAEVFVNIKRKDGGYYMRAGIVDTGAQTSLLPEELTAILDYRLS